MFRFLIKTNQISIFKDITFTIKNTTVAISVKSGAGKTTLVGIILGLLKPTKGTVVCDDKDIENNIKGWRNNLSYVPQNIFLTDDTIRNNVAFGVDPKKEMKIFGKRLKKLNSVLLLNNLQMD